MWDTRRQSSWCTLVSRATQVIEAPVIKRNLGKSERKDGNQLEDGGFPLSATALIDSLNPKQPYLFRSDSFDVITARLAAARELEIDEGIG